MDSTNFMEFSLSSTLGGAITQYFKLPPMYSASIGMACMYFFKGFQLEKWHMICGGLFCIGWYIIKIYKSGVPNIKSISSIKLCTNGAIRDLQIYMKKYKSFYDKHYNVTKGNMDALCNNKDSLSLMDWSVLTQLEENQKIYFKDTNFNINGYISIEKQQVSSKTEKEDKTINFLIPSICVYQTNKINASQYFDKIQKRNEKNRNNDNNIKLYSVKVLTFTKGSDQHLWNHECVIYDGVKNNIDERKEKYMKTFFHPQKDYLLSFIDKIQNDPEFFQEIGQTAQLNLILYGPPGTGKSTFAYRLAQCTNRHLVSIDLTTIKSKKHVYQIIQTPCVDNIRWDASNCIIILEEFDIVIKNLHEKNLLKQKFLSNKDKKDNDDISHGTMNSEDIQIEDLLEILQGPAPREGQIIIATTNRFEEISKICPALFRPGRLTPVKFDYMKADEINKLAQVYLGYEFDIDFDPQIPTSQIIEFALAAKMNDNPQYFIDELCKFK